MLLGFLLGKIFSHRSLQSLTHKLSDEFIEGEIIISKENQPVRNPIIDKNAYTRGHILIVPYWGKGEIGLYNKRGYFEKIWSTQHTTLYGELIPRPEGYSILVVHKNKKFFHHPLYFYTNTGLIAIYNNNGVLETSFEDVSLHHDIEVKTPSRIFALSRILKTMKHKNTTVRIVDDSIIEINLKTKKIVKRLILSDYFPLPDHLPEATADYKNSINLFHANSINYIKENPFNGNEAVLVTMKNYLKGTIALIDLKTNKLLWQSPRSFFLYPHDGKFTKDKTITVFDNGDHKRLKSRFLELDIKKNKIVWEYDPSNDQNGVLKAVGVPLFKNDKNRRKSRIISLLKWQGIHFSRHLSGIQKTDKGYLITSGQYGNIFEISKEHKIVWLLPAAASVFRFTSGMPAIRIFKARQYDEDVLPFSEESISDEFY